MPKPASNVTHLVPPAAGEPEHQLALLTELGQEAQSALQSFTKRMATGTPIDVLELSRQFGDLFSLFVDLTAHTTAAHKDHYEWGGEVDEELDRLGDLVDGDTSRLTPTDAGTLKAVITALIALVPVEAATESTRARGLEAIQFIDEVTISDGDDEDDEEDEEGDEDEEPGAEG